MFAQTSALRPGGQRTEVPRPARRAPGYHKDLANKSGGRLYLVGGINSTSIAGQPAQSYEMRSSSGKTFRTIIVFRGGVTYIIEMAAPSGRFASANSGPFHTFLSSWRWE